jgi:hypothetical protein
VTSLAFACAMLVAPAPAAAAGAAAPGRSDARARLVACKPALDQLSRSLVVDSVMRALAPGDRMQMRFDLYQRKPSALRFRRMAPPGVGLGVWNPSTPGFSRFRYRKAIQNLAAPAVYFVKVSYRWLDAAGTVTARTARRTGLCNQPDLRPDLRIVDAGQPRRLGPSEFAYRVVLHNAGRTAAGSFDVVPVVNGVRGRSTTVPGLLAGERRAVDVIGPRCPSGGRTAIVVDPDNRVDEANEANNTRWLTCA